jgi:hypothetical protein
VLRLPERGCYSTQRVLRKLSQRRTLRSLPPQRVSSRAESIAWMSRRAI